MGKYKSMMQALAPRPDDIPKSESDAVYYRLGFNQARGAAVLLAENADLWIGCVAEERDRLRKERDESRAEVDRLTRARDDTGDGRKQDAKELARLRSIIRQMVREEAERRIEALGVGEDAGSELVYVRPRFGKQRCECRLQAGDSPCPMHVQRENIDAGEGDQ